MDIEIKDKFAYAGLKWTKPAKYDNIDGKIIEFVERGNCGLVQEIV